MDAAHSGVVYISFEGSDLTDHRWTPAKNFGASATSPISGLLPLETTVNDPGSLRVLANANGKLLHLSRGGQTGVWNEPNPVLSSVQVTGVPAFLQHTYRNQGNLDLVSPAEKGGLFQSYLSYSDPTGSWAQPVYFGSEIGVASGVSITQIPTWPDGSPGFSEVIAIAGTKIWNTYRNGSGEWQPLEHILQDYQVKGNPAFIMGRFGRSMETSNLWSLQRREVGWCISRDKTIRDRLRGPPASGSGLGWGTFLAFRLLMVKTRALSHSLWKSLPMRMVNYGVSGWWVKLGPAPFQWNPSKASNPPPPPPNP